MDKKTIIIITVVAIVGIIGYYLYKKKTTETKTVSADNNLYSAASGQNDGDYDAGTAASTAVTQHNEIAALTQEEQDAYYEALEAQNELKKLRAQYTTLTGQSAKTTWTKEQLLTYIDEANKVNELVKLYNTTTGTEYDVTETTTSSEVEAKLSSLIKNWETEKNKAANMASLIATQIQRTAKQRHEFGDITAGRDSLTTAGKIYCVRTYDNTYGTKMTDAAQAAYDKCTNIQKKWPSSSMLINTLKPFAQSVYDSGKNISNIDIYGNVI